MRYLLARARSACAGEESGTAVLEFIVVGVLLTLPVFYLVIALARLQAGAYAVTAAARESGRTFVTAPDPASGLARARASARMSFQDQGFGGQGSIRVACAKQPCLARGNRVETTADLSVRLPLVPSFLSSVVPTSVHLHADHVATVDRFRAGS